ncbi:hypothetical protein ABK040_009021 [Willaertia magna]
MSASSSPVNDHTSLSESSTPQQVIVELMKLYYNHGWVSGTGGGISIKKGSRIYIAPSGIHKERIKHDQIFVLDDSKDENTENTKPICNFAGCEHLRMIYNPNDHGYNFKISACQPLFQLCYSMRGAGAVIHSHALSAMLATLVFDKEFKVTHLEMIKGIKGNGFYDTLVVPIIENTAYEEELTDSMREAMEKYPNTFAVLVKRHGVYIWGKDWVEAKTHAEVYHYLFECAVKMKQLGFDPSVPPTTN